MESRGRCNDAALGTWWISAKWLLERSWFQSIPVSNFHEFSGYPQSCAVEAGGLIFCSGMLAVNPVTGEREHGTVTSETRRIFENLKILLEENGSDLARIVQVHAMTLQPAQDRDVLNRVYRQYLPESPPARMVWQVVIENGFKVQLHELAAAGTGSTKIRDRHGRLLSQGTKSLTSRKVAGCLIHPVSELAIFCSCWGWFPPTRRQESISICSFPRPAKFSRISVTFWIFGNFLL